MRPLATTVLVSALPEPVKPMDSRANFSLSASKLECDAQMFANSGSAFAGPDEVTPADAYFGRAPAIIELRERITRRTIKYQR